MKKKHNCLIWAVLAAAVVLSLVVLFDGWAYSEIRKENPDMPFAAVFIAATQKGIYPWTAPAVTEPEVSDELTQAVETAAVETVAEATTLEATAAEAAADEESTAAQETAAGQNDAFTLTAVRTGTSNGNSGPGAAAADESAEPLAEAGSPQYTTAGVYYFADACFIGDSLTEGLQCYAKIPKTDFYGHQGVNTYGILKQQFTLPNGGKGTLEEALSQKQYAKIYIMLGINELGSDSPEKFAERYKGIIEKIRAKQPDALIFIQGILHTTEKKSSSSQFKNSIINANNAALAAIADNEKVFFIDINPLFDDETGALRADYSGDGVHIKASHYVEWRDYLLQHAIF